MPNHELVEGLEARGAEVRQVSVYRWALPEDTVPLQRAIGEIASGAIDVLLVTSANQIRNLMQVASQRSEVEQVRRGLERSRGSLHRTDRERGFAEARDSSGL